MVFKEKEYVPRRCCEDKYLKILRGLGYTDILGYERELEGILLGNGDTLPNKVVDKLDVSYEYRIGATFHSFLNYADACAKKIIDISEK